MAAKIVNPEIKPPLRQRSWGWPAVVNLSLGGAGAGLYLLGTWVSFRGSEMALETQVVPFQVLATLLVCVGFGFVALEAGRPLRAFRLAAKLPESWMSIESLSGFFFVVVGISAFFTSNSLLYFSAVLAALVLLISQGMMVYRARAMVVWNLWIIPVVFVTSGLMTACGLALLNTHPYSATLTIPTNAIFIFAILNLVVWFFYLRLGRGQFNPSVAFLQRPLILSLIVFIGHLLPMMILWSMPWVANVQNSASLIVVLRIASGLMLIVGGVSQKIGIVFAAGFFRPMVLTRQWQAPGN